MLHHFVVSAFSVTSFSKEAIKVAYQSAGCCTLIANHSPCSIVRVPGYTASGFTCEQAKELHCSASEDTISPTCGELCYGVHSSGPCSANVSPTIDHVDSYTIDPLTGDHQNSSFLASLSGLTLAQVDAHLREGALHPSSLRYALLNLPDGRNLVQFLYVPPTYTSNTLWNYVRSATDDSDPAADIRTYQTLELVASPSSELLSAFQTKHSANVSGWDVFKYTGDFNIEYHAATNRIGPIHVLAKFPGTTAYVTFQEFGVRFTEYDTLQELLSSITSPPIVDLDDLVATLTAPGGALELAEGDSMYYNMIAAPIEKGPRVSRPLNIFRLPSDLSTLNNSTQSIGYLYQHWFNPDTGSVISSNLVSYTNQRYTTDKAIVPTAFKAFLMAVSGGMKNVDAILDSGNAVFFQGSALDDGNPRVYASLIDFSTPSDLKLDILVYAPTYMGGPLETFPPVGWMQDSDLSQGAQTAVTNFLSDPSQAMALFAPGITPLPVVGVGLAPFFDGLVSGLHAADPVAREAWTSYKSEYGYPSSPYSKLYTSLDDMRSAFQSVPTPEAIFDISTATSPPPATSISVEVAANANGAGNVYVMDGVQQKSLDLSVGTTYAFAHSSAHPFRFSTTSDGTHGGGAAYTTGVTTTSGTTVIEVTAGTPTSMYYYCTAHAGMGGSVTNMVQDRL